jgi:hypothetical protein
MRPGRLAKVLAGLSLLCLTASPAVAGESREDKPGKAVQAPAESVKKKDVALTRRPCTEFRCLDKVIQDITTRLQERIEQDFEQYLETQMKKMDGNITSSVGGSLLVG